MTTVNLRHGRFEVKAAPWRSVDHPRDSRGRFIETGAEVRILGGARGRVIRSVGNGRIEVERDSDGKRVIVHRGNLTVLTRPDGSDPTDSRDDKPAPMPEQAPSRDAVDAGVGDGDDNRRTDADAPGTPVGQRLSPFDDPELVAAAEVIPLGGIEAVDDTHAHLSGRVEPDEDGEVQVQVEDMRQVYDFRAWELDVAVASIATANRRAERAGIEQRFTYEVERYEQNVRNEVTGMTDVIERVRLTLSRPTIQHDGWKFVSTLTWEVDDDGTQHLITRNVPDAVLHNRPEARRCDVCHANRDRRDTYVIQQGDQELQVGSNCLTQFMGIRPANLWMLGWDLELDSEGDDDGGGMRGVPFRDQRFVSTEVLAIGLAIVDKHGWVPRSRSNERVRATADLFEDFITGTPRTDEGRRWRESIADSAEDFTAEAAAVLDMARTIDGDSDYVVNLRTAAAPERVSGRNLALLLSAISLKQRQEQREREEVQPKAESQWVGTEGGKITPDTAVTVLAVRHGESNYGRYPKPNSMLTFMDAEGNVFKWWSSNRIDDFGVGDSVRISGSVKKHDEYRGVRETVLTRVKIKGTPEQEAEKAARAKAAKAAQDAEDARMEAINARREVEVPEGEGYVTLDPDSPFPPVGTRVRWGYTSKYEGYIVSRTHENFNGTDVVLITNEDPYASDFPTQVPRSAIFAITPDQDIAEGTRKYQARRAQTSTPVGEGWVYNGKPVSEVLDDVEVDEVIRVREGDLVLDARIISINPPEMTVRMPDGEVRVLEASSAAVAAVQGD